MASQWLCVEEITDAASYWHLQYLGTAQQCTEVSTLLWLQDLPHCGKNCVQLCNQM